MNKLLGEASVLMRPPGAGIFTLSAGRNPLNIQRKIYQKSKDADLSRAWEKSYDHLDRARAVIIGVPSDSGGGIRRGAAHGPFAIRDTLLRQPQYHKWLNEFEVIDLGDIAVNPHFLEDSMLNERTIAAAQNAMYGDSPIRHTLPVAPLTQFEFVLRKLWSAHPKVHVFAIGGDHSVAWPMSKVLIERYGKSLGILQIDAHTDLLDSRLGVEICFGSWSYHANELLGRSGRMVQVGIRQTLQKREHWEAMGVKQIWAEDVKQPTERRITQDIVTHLRNCGVKQLYFTNDIDGTDERFASATGTPAAKGLTPKFVLNLIKRLKSEFQWVASDIMEVAPDLGPSLKDRAKTCETAAQYAMECLRKV